MVTNLHTGCSTLVDSEGPSGDTCIVLPSVTPVLSKASDPYKCGLTVNNISIIDYLYFWHRFISVVDAMNNEGNIGYLGVEITSYNDRCRR